MFPWSKIKVWWESIIPSYKSESFEKRDSTKQLHYAETQNNLGSSQKSSARQWSKQAEVIV